MLCKGEGNGVGSSLSITCFNCVHPRFLLNDWLNIEDDYCKLQSSLPVCP